MSDDSKSFEKKLDRDFLYYLNLTKRLFKNVTEESDQQLCEVWLTHLLGKTISSVAEKCNRNIFLSRLLLQMQNGKLTGIFLETPSSGPLPCAFTAFGLPIEVEGLKGFEEMGFQIDSSVGGNFGDISESSRDGRTYLATRRLPQGIMAYIAVTNNEGEPAWIPQSCRSKSFSISSDKKAEGYSKRLTDCIEETLFANRKSPEDRECVLEWMDKIINDCNLWIQGKDPHNIELESLFEQLYELYKEDPENSELLNHPRSVRTILFKEIRDKIAERRAEVSKRELILDKYESDRYTEVRESDEYLDEVWLECAKRPLKDYVRSTLEPIYPPEIIQRFTELLYQERLLIIQRGEREAKKKIAELRKESIEDTKRELQRLKKVQNEYKEYYSIYKDVEENVIEFKKEYKEKCLRPEKTNPEAVEKFKQERGQEIQQAKRDLDKELKIQSELREKLEEALEVQRKFKERIAAEEEKLNCETNQLRARKEDLLEQINILKKRKGELTCEINRRKRTCGR